MGDGGSGGVGVTCRGSSSRDESLVGLHPQRQLSILLGHILYPQIQHIDLLLPKLVCMLSSAAAVAAAHSSCRLWLECV